MGVLMTAVPCWCWFLMWEPGGHQLTKCSVRLATSIFKFWSLIKSYRMGTWLPLYDQLFCFKEQGPAFELSNMDWESIKLVTSWLKSFRAATTEMSATKVPILSTTHAIFRGLQDDIKTLFFAISLIRYHQILRWASQMPTASSVITTTSTMLLPSIHGLHVRAKSFAWPFHF
jgi:hypothetical protein